MTSSHHLARELSRRPVATRSFFWSATITLAWLAPWLGLVSAQVPTTQLTTVFPPGAKAGTAVEVRVGGADLDDATQLVFSHPGIRAVAKQSPATEFEKAKPVPGVFSVQVAGDVPPGSYDVRVAGRFGISNPRSFVIGGLTEANDPGGNNQPTAAMALPVDSTVNGVVDGNQMDHFKLSLKAGQRVLLNCEAQRIDSRLDGVLVVFDPAGKELRRSRGFVGRDPLVDLTAAADGDYLVKLYDFTYRGGGEYYYRLTAHTAPYIDFIFPPSGLAGSNEEYTLYGRNLPGGQPAEGVSLDGVPLQKLVTRIALPSNDESRRGVQFESAIPAPSAFLDGRPFRLGNSNSVQVQFAKGTVVREIEPNNLSAQSQVVQAPCEVVGQFAPEADIDSFTFAARKGDVFDIEVYAHRLGLESDPFLIVQKVKRNEKGEEAIQEIAQVDDPGDRAGRIGSEFDTSTDDPQYQLRADEDANYRVIVRDQFGDSRNDARFVYRLAIHRGEPDYRLVAYSTSVVAPANPNAVPLGGNVLRKGGSTMLQVQLERRYGFVGDVEISAQGLPAGVSCPSVIVGPQANSAALILTAAEDAAGWTGPIRVVGKAQLDGVEAIRSARAGVPVWGSGNRTTEYVAYRLAREVTLAVVDKEVAPALVQVAEDKVWETSRGGKLDIPIKVARRGEFKDDLTLAPVDVPNELKPANLAIKGAEAEGKLAFAATNANAKPGIYTFYLRADAKWKHQRNPEAVAVAEQEQKDVDAAVAASTEKNKQATDAKNMAVTVAQNMTNAAKQAEQAKAAAETEAKQAVEKFNQADAALKTAKEAAAKDAANQALAQAATAAEKARADAEAAKTAAEQKLAAAQKTLGDSQTAAKTAEDAKVAAEKAAAEADARLKAVQQVKAATDKRLNDAKAANNPKDLQFAVISTPIKVRVVESCLKVAAPAVASAKVGEKAPITATLTRLYGFEDPAEVVVELPNGVKGLSANKADLPKGQAEGKLEIVTTKETPPGEYTITLRAKAKFNGVDNQASQTVQLVVTP